MLRARHGPAAAGYVDTAVLFLLAACRHCRPEDRVLLIQPESDAGGCAVPPRPAGRSSDGVDCGASGWVGAMRSPPACGSAPRSSRWVGRTRRGAAEVLTWRGAQVEPARPVAVPPAELAAAPTWGVVAAPLRGVPGARSRGALAGRLG